MINRRSVLVGGSFLLLAVPASSRSMYCTRHRRACQERRERQALWDAQEAERRTLLTPEQRAKEDAERAAAVAAERQRWEDTQKSERAERQRRLWSGLALAGGITLVLGVRLFAILSWPWEKRK